MQVLRLVRWLLNERLVEHDESVREQSQEELGRRVHITRLSAVASMAGKGQFRADATVLKSPDNQPASNLFLESDRFQERRLNPVLWMIVAIVTAASVTIAFGAVAAGAKSSPLLLGLPFLAVIAISLLTFMLIDHHVRRRSLLKAARDGGFKTMKLRSKVEFLEQHIDRPS